MKKKTLKRITDNFLKKGRRVERNVDEKGTNQDLSKMSDSK
jgi:(2Fe-2S) ferredoxin